MQPTPATPGQNPDKSLPFNLLRDDLWMAHLPEEGHSLFSEKGATLPPLFPQACPTSSQGQHLTITGWVQDWTNAVQQLQQPVHIPPPPAEQPYPQAATEPPTTDVAPKVRINDGSGCTCTGRGYSDLEDQLEAYFREHSLQYLKRGPYSRKNKELQMYFQERCRAGLLKLTRFHLIDFLEKMRREDPISCLYALFYLNETLSPPEILSLFENCYRRVIGDPGSTVLDKLNLISVLKARRYRGTSLIWNYFEMFEVHRLIFELSRSQVPYPLVAELEKLLRTQIPRPWYKNLIPLEQCQIKYKISNALWDRLAEWCQPGPPGPVLNSDPSQQPPQVVAEPPVSSQVAQAPLVSLPTIDAAPPDRKSEDGKLDSCTEADYKSLSEHLIAYFWKYALNFSYPPDDKSSCVARLQSWCVASLQRLKNQVGHLIGFLTKMVNDNPKCFFLALSHLNQVDCGPYGDSLIQKCYREFIGHLGGTRDKLEVIGLLVKYCKRAKLTEILDNLRVHELIISLSTHTVDGQYQAGSDILVYSDRLELINLLRTQYPLPWFKNLIPADQCRIQSLIPSELWDRLAEWCQQGPPAPVLNSDPSQQPPQAVAEPPQPVPLPALLSTSSPSSPAPLPTPVLTLPPPPVARLKYEMLDIDRFPLCGKKFSEAVNDMLRALAPGKPLHSQLASLLKKNKVVWSFDIDEIQHKETFLKIVQGAVSSADHRQLAIAKTVIGFFNFCTKNPFTEERALEILQDRRAKHEEILNALVSLNQIHSPKPLVDLLGEETANEVYLTLLAKKLEELETMGAHFDQWIRLKKSSQKKPCFIIAQDVNTARAFITQALFGPDGSLFCFQADSDNSAEEMLHAQCQMRRTAVEGKEKSVQIPSTHLDILNKTVQTTRPLPFLIFHRDATLSQSFSPHGSPVSPPQEAPKKRERNVTAGDVNDPTVSRKRRPSPTKDDLQEMVRERLSPTSKPPAALDPQEGPGFKPLEEILNADRKRAITASVLGSDALAPGSNKKAKAQDVDPMESFADFWDSVARREINDVNHEVKKAASRSLAFGMKPLEHPLFNVFQNLPPQEDKFPLLNRLMKPYQVEMAKFFVHLAKHKIAGVLALEMGLGKTLIYLEFILQSILGGLKGRHLVVVRKAILDSVCGDLEKFLKESKRSAWEASLKIQRDPKIIDRFCQSLVEAIEKRADNLPHFLSLCHYIPKEKLQERIRHKITQGQIDNEFLRNHLFFPINAHLNELKKCGALSIQQLVGRFDSCNLVLSQFTNSLSNSTNPRVAQLQEILQKAKQDPFHIDFTQLPDVFTDRPMRFQGDSAEYVAAMFQMAGVILNFNPRRTSLDLGNGYSQEGLDAILETQIIKIEAKDTDTWNKAKGKNHAIVITTINSVIEQQDLVTQNIDGAVAVDEAQDYKGEEANRSIQLQEILSLREKRLGKKLPTLIVSATPYENRLSELLNLCSIGNSDLFPKSTTDALEELRKKCIAELTHGRMDSSKYRETKARQKVAALFAHLTVLLDSLKLVKCLKMQDSHVFEQWQGMVPKKDSHAYDVSRFVSKQALDIIASNNGKRTLAIEEKHRILKALTHPAWSEGNLAKNEHIERDINMFREGTNTQGMQEWINKSALLKALIENEPFNQALVKKEKIVIFVEHEATGLLLKWAIQNMKGAKSSIYSGSNSNTHGQMITDFKEGDTQVFIATVKSGGAGLNLNEGIHSFFLTKSWNPAIDAQAEGRTVRVGKDRLTHHMHYFDWGTDYEVFHDSVLKEKEALRKFVDERTFDSFLNYLKAMCYHELMNESKDRSIALSNLTIIKGRLREIQSSISEDELKKLILAVSPKDSEVKDTEPQIEEGPKIPQGYENIGNSCYINAVLSMLGCIPGMSDVLPNNNSEAIKNLRSKIFAYCSINPQELGLQQDAAQVLEYICDLPPLKDQTLIQYAEKKQGKGSSELVDCPCQQIHILQLPVLVSQSLTGILQNDFLHETTDEPFREYKGHQTFREMQRSGNVLMIQLKRFNNQREKIQAPVIVEEVITVGNKTYQLTGFVEHFGNTIQRGHYVSIVKQDGKWWHINDDDVTEVDNPNPNNGYLFCYQEVSPDQVKLTLTVKAVPMEAVQRTEPLQTAAACAKLSPLRQENPLVVVPIRIRDCFRRALLAGFLLRNNKEHAKKIKCLLSQQDAVHKQNLVFAGRYNQWNDKQKTMKEMLDSLIAEAEKVKIPDNLLPVKYRIYEIQGDKYVVATNSSDPEAIKLLRSTIPVDNNKVEHWDLLI